MNQTSPSLQTEPWKLWVVMILLVILISYLLAESAVRWHFAPNSGTYKSLSEFREKAQRNGLSMEEYARRVGLDGCLGWGRSEVYVHEPQAGAPRPRTLVFVGDSVTAGHDVRSGVEDYPSLLAGRFEAQGIRVVNLATMGYGVDQMWLKLLTEAGRYHPDMIVFAYIPHDLLRPGSDFNFGLTKPRFQFAGSLVSLRLPQGVPELMAEFERARSWFHLSGWLLARYWANKEYYAYHLFSGYYRQLYRHIGGGLAQLSEEWGIPVRVVKLTNYRRANRLKALTELAATEFVHPTVWENADVGYLDTDECVATRAKSQALDLKKEFAYHPGPMGHRLLAECLEPSIAAALNPNPP